MQLIRPHLYELDRLARRRRTGVPQLTPREWQVLELAAEGLGNQQIARTLVTSLSTVRKHLEHIYLKTGARSRGAAVAMMMPCTSSDVAGPRRFVSGTEFPQPLEPVRLIFPPATRRHREVLRLWRSTAPHGGIAFGQVQLAELLGT